MQDINPQVIETLAPTTSSHCPVCGAQHSQQVVEIRQVPVFCNVLLESHADAVNVARGDIVLEHCGRCGHLYNSAFDPKLMEYDPIYENSLHFSPRFQAFATELASELIDRYALRGKQIVEIGSGRGDFLKMLCELGNNKGMGFDPSYSPTTEDAQQDRVRFVTDVYGEQYTDVPLDFICSRHTLEHLADPITFVQTVRNAIGRRHAVPCYLEVPNALYTLRDLGIWDLIYEHHSYFCPSSLRHLCESNGFDVARVTERYAGQFLSIEMLPGQHDAAAVEGVRSENDTARYIDDFASEYQTKVARMQTTLQEIKQLGKRCVLWGAGSKGVTFLNVLQVTDEVEFVIDINARKQGKHIAGTGQKIVAPDYLTHYQPDVVIVMNPIYVDEITMMMARMGLDAEITVV